MKRLWTLVIFLLLSLISNISLSQKINDRFASTSPDGKLIAFESNRAVQREVLTINSNGTGLLNLSKGQGNSRFGSWFPNGSKALFSSDRHGQGYRLFTMETDGSKQEILSIKD